ncbi:hypothetical protein LTR08_005616 [Meristemomyces frigidus]|nr:hypothetical protein LTR08_005616 [Meristemomyces frigidus]
MPPKKGKAKATPAKAKAAPEPPATITNNRGKEIETTAATARPRRATVAATPVPQKTAAKKGTATKVKDPAPSSSPRKSGRSVKTKAVSESAEEVEPPKKRGRPAKSAVEEPDEDAEPPKKRGRPAKAVVEEPEEDAEPPKKRGRPAKAAVEEPAEDIEPPKERARAPTAKAKEEAVEPSKKRGRPAKDKAEEPVEVAEPPKKRTRKAKDDVDESAAAATETPKKRGRSARPQPAPAVVDDEQAAPRRRGRPPKGGQTTKIDSADGDAAQQLEDELMDDADAEVEPVPAPRKRKPAAAAKKGKAVKNVKAADEVEDDVDAGAEDAEAAHGLNDGGKQYWLMKAEQEDRVEKATDGSMVNTKFTIDDLRAKGVPELWDGVRNPSAAKNIRAMKQGDLAFFYASGGKQGRHPGIVGIMEIVSEAEFDATTADEGTAYYEPDEEKRDKWCVVGVQFSKKLTKPVALKELQQYAKEKGVLSEMQLLKQMRLSVGRVSEKEWNFIIDNLIEEGYEEDSDEANDLTGARKVDEKIADSDELNSIAGAEQADELMGDAEVDGELPTADESIGSPDMSAMPGGLPEMALPSVENDLPTTDTMGPSTTAATSRPASRAVSRAVSRAGSRAPSVALSITDTTARTGSRAPSAAPSINGAAARKGSRAPSAAPSVKKVVEKAPVPRAGSLAPAAVAGRASSRGRSRTPKPRASSAQPFAVAMGTVAEEEDMAMDLGAE